MAWTIFDGHKAVGILSPLVQSTNAARNDADNDGKAVNDEDGGCFGDKWYEKVIHGGPKGRTLAA